MRSGKWAAIKNPYQTDPLLVGRLNFLVVVWLVPSELMVVHVPWPLSGAPSLTFIFINRISISVPLGTSAKTGSRRVMVTSEGALILDIQGSHLVDRSPIRSGMISSGP